MATRTAKSRAPSVQQKQNTEPGWAPAGEPVLADGATAPSADGATYWGDRFAFKVWVVCFLLMALMTAYDLITGLLRGGGGN